MYALSRRLHRGTHLSTETIFGPFELPCWFTPPPPDSLLQMVIIRVLVWLWVRGRGVVKVVSMLARELLTGAMGLPSRLLPRKYVLLIYAVSRSLLTHVSCISNDTRSLCPLRCPVLCASRKFVKRH